MIDPCDDAFQKYGDDVIMWRRVHGSSRCVLDHMSSHAIRSTFSNTRSFSQPPLPRTHACTRTSVCKAVQTQTRRRRQKGGLKMNGDTAALVWHPRGCLPRFPALTSVATGEAVWRGGDRNQEGCDAEETLDRGLAQCRQYMIANIGRGGQRRGQVRHMLAAVRGRIDGGQLRRLPKNTG